MAAIIYLDAEDEITSAAARIRSARERRVVLVLPFGSRVATSRINFRLLAREAAAAGRELDIVAPDATARALAASAGLAAFASVTELEAALAHPEEEQTTPRPAPAPGASGPRSGPGAGIRSDRGRGTADDPDATRRVAAVREPGTGHTSETEPSAGRGRLAATARPEPRGRGPGLGRLLVLGVVALVVGVGGYAGWTFLPAAEITITPRVTSLGPVSITVTADPAVTGVNAAAGVIPAITIEVPVSASGEFKSTGKRVETTKATGTVRFDSINTIGQVSVPAGTRVSTLSGVVFVTGARVVVPKATVSGTTIKHGTVDVAVQASKDGPDGNVGKAEITQEPAELSTQAVSVTNPAATTGGARTEFPKVLQSDVDAATTSLRHDLQARFTGLLAAPENVPTGATVFPETAFLGEPNPDPGPSPVGQEVAAFTLTLNATGTVLAVDPSPVRTIAESRLKAAVEPGRTLVPGSVSVIVGEGTVVSGVVTFTADAHASVVRDLDAAALRRDVLGMPRARAEALLAQYGEVHLGLWPDWAADVPAIDARVTLTVLPPADSASPTPSPSGASPAPSPSPSPSAAAGS